MTDIPFVKREHADLARAMESTLLGVSDESKILFVGVTVRASLKGEEPIYHVFIGCSREISEEAIRALVRVKLSLFIASGEDVTVDVHRGVAHGS